MIAAPLPDNEEERLRALRELDILDTIEEQAYDDLTYLAAQICQTPIALVSLIDQDRQWFKSHHGLDARETPRDYAFCAHAILDDKTFVVNDSENDERFHDNPLVTDEPHVKFYAGVPLLLENNIPVGTLCVIDNYARKLTQEQKKSLEALSRQVVNNLELRLKLQQLEVLDKTKEQFISMVSHELRTPLTSINGSLSIMANTMSDKMEADAVKMTDIAFRNSERLLDIVNDILDVAKIDSGRFELDFAEHNLIDVISESIELNTPFISKCDCNIAFKISAGMDRVIVNVDKNRVQQVMNNLISNAAKFTHDKDTIEVNVYLEDNKAFVSVTDHGNGIPEKQQPYVFTRFSHISSGVNTKLPGTGLGLHICKSIIEQHNGAIDFRSKTDEGSQFFFWLPISGTS